ncbi:hypothetical protein KDK77_07960 [bacterium]|nr:hypothetical protein [bacterium]MCP5461628.1 hypothetical protein [bacterium]
MRLSLLFCIIFAYFVIETSVCSIDSAAEDTTPTYQFQGSDTETHLEHALTLLKNNRLAEAAIAFFVIQHNPFTPTQHRTTVLNQFSYTINRLRSDQQQTDIFGQLIRRIPNDQHQKLLLTHYASMLESQNRTTETVEIYRQIYRQWPGTQEKYTLAQKLQKAGYYQESYDLFSEMLENTQYRSPVLRQMLETVHFLNERNILFAHLFSKYGADIEFKYDLLNAAFAAALELKDYERAKDITVKLLLRYPYSTDTVLQKLVPLAQNGTFNSADISELKTLFPANMSDDQRYVLAHLYAASGAVETAIQTLAPVSEQKALEYKADLLYSTGNLEPAHQIYTTLVNTYGTTLAWYQKLADISFKQNNEAMTKNYLYKFLEVSPKHDFNTYFYVGKMFERYGFAEDAKHIYMLGKHSAYDKSSASQEIIKFYLSQHDFASAAEEIVYTQTNDIIPPHNLYDSLSDLFYDRTMFNSLISALETHINADSSLTELHRSAVYYCLSVFCLESSDIQRAIAYFKSYFSLNPRKESDVFTLSSRLESEGYVQEAYDILMLVPSVSPHYKTILNKQAHLQCRLGNPFTALELLHRHPDFIDPLIWAEIYVHAGDFDTAANHLNKIMQFTPEYFRIKGDISFANKQFSQARAEYERISANSEFYHEARLSIALTHLFDNHSETATGLLEELILLYPNTDASNRALYFRKMISLCYGNDAVLSQWIQAEFSYWKKDFTTASQQFSALVNEYPYEIFIPELRFRLFDTSIFLHEYDTARVQIQSLTDQFPDTPLIPYLMCKMLEEPFASEEKTSGYKKILYSHPNTYDADIIRNILRDMESKTIKEEIK